jgi:putative solute:sodium symporter small subunit
VKPARPCHPIWPEGRLFFQSVVVSLTLFTVVLFHRTVVSQAHRANTQEESMQVPAKLQEYWRRNLNLTGLLLLVWFFVTFVLGYFARDLSFNFFGWPFAFYMGAQGALIVYLLIIWYYASAMNKLDKEYGVDEEEIQ